MYYQYIAYKEEQVAKGIQFAPNEDKAAKILSDNGYKILSLKPTSRLLTGQEQISSLFNKVPPESIITFSRQFALLHESGIDIVSALELLKVHISNRELKKVIGNIITDLNKGTRLSEAVGKYPQAFSKMYVQSIKIGEQTGNLEQSLRQIADYMERENKSLKAIQNALRYPALVAVVAVIVVALLSTFVLPTFINLYKSLDAQLPGSTKLLLSMLEWFNSYGLYFIAIIIGLGVLVYFWRRTRDGRLKWDEMAFKVPYLGHVAHLNELIRCCRSMSILYKSGLPVPDILKMTIENTSNAVMKRALTDVHHSVMKGEGLAGPMGKNPVFMDMMVQMVSVGEATGTLDKTLMATAETYEKEAEDRMHSFIAFLQPAITIIIGLVVAMIAISLVSAMYSIYGQIS